MDTLAQSWRKWLRCPFCTTSRKLVYLGQGQSPSLWAIPHSFKTWRAWCPECRDTAIIRQDTELKDP